MISINQSTEMTVHIIMVIQVNQIDTNDLLLFTIFYEFAI